MGGPIASLLARFRRTDRPTDRSAPAAASPAEKALTARALADAIDRAMDMGLWEHAERIARSALRLAPASARLSEQLARLRLAQGRPETALTIIDSPWAQGEMYASLRLLRAVCLVQVGRKQSAHSDLLRWSKKSTAPLDARLMLALLEWEAGDDHAATLSLLRNLKHQTVALVVNFKRVQDVRQVGVKLHIDYGPDDLRDASCVGFCHFITPSLVSALGAFVKAPLPQR